MKIVGPFLKINLQKKKPQDPNPKQKHKRERESERWKCIIPKSSPRSKLESESSLAASSKNWRTSRFLFFPVLSSSPPPPRFRFPAGVFPAMPLPLPLSIWKDGERERASVWMRVTGGTLDLPFIRGIFRDFTIVSLMSSSMISLIWFCVSSFFPYLARPFYIAFFFVVNLHFRS